MSRRLIAFLSLIRLHNVAAAVLSVFVGFSMTRSTDYPWLLLAAVTLSTASGNVINDIFDRDIDSINKPSRPIPSGALSLSAAVTIYVLLTVGAAVLSLGLDKVEKYWILAWIVLLFFYSFKFKRMVILGNVTVASVSASGFLLGSYHGGCLKTGIIPALFTFFFVLGREIVKDSDDIVGDSRCRARTFPIAIGVEPALKVSAVIFILLATAFPLPYFLDVYSKWYGLVMFVSVVPILVASFVFSLQHRRLSTVSSLLKCGMFFGVLAFYLAWKG